jgi:hypothetical protein
MLDGTVLLKGGKELPYTREIAEITTGDWTSRLAAFKKCFGAIPSGMASQIPVLDKIRQ